MIPNAETGRPQGARDARSLMRSDVRVTIADGPDKLVWLPSEEQPVAMGMRDELVAHYQVDMSDRVARASTLDYLVGSVAACLTGTLKRALTARGVEVRAENLRAEAIGDIVLQRDVPVLRSIEVEYFLSGTSPEQSERIDRAHAVHHRACAVSASVEKAIDIRTSLTLV